MFAYPNKWFNITACTFFVAGGLLSLQLQQPQWMMLPFVWLFIQPLTHFFIHKTSCLFWALLILLPLSTELSISNSLSTDFPDEPILWLLTIAVIARLLQQPYQFYHSVQSPVVLLIVLCIGWTSFTIIFSTEPLLSVKFLLAKIWYIVPFVLLTPLLLQSNSNYKRIAICLCLPMLFIIIQTLIRHSFYGFDFVSIKKILSPFFRNHVNYSAMLVCLLPAAWLLRKFTPAKSLQRKLINLSLIIAFTGLFFAYSRGAWLALLAGIIASWLVQKKIIGRFIFAAILLIILAISALVYNNYYLQFAPEHDQTIFHTEFRDHLNATVTLKDISNAERFHRWVAGARMVTEKPITGFGANSFYSQYQPYTVSPFKTWVSNNPEHSTVHNYFLLTAIEQGIPGLILLATLWIYLLLQTQYLYHQFQNEYYRHIAMAVGVVLTMIATINCTSDMLETDKIGGLFWLCAGLVIALQNQLKEEGDLMV